MCFENYLTLSLLELFEQLGISNSYDTADNQEANPIDFYKLIIPNSKDIYIRLGYFTTYALSILSIPLTEFLLTEGTINIITNHFLTQDDVNNIIDYDISPKKIDELERIYKRDPREFEEFLRKGSTQFYNCINYLQEKGRLQIQPVFFTDDNLNSHHKQVIATDGEHYLFTSGSSNLTAGGLVINGENISVHRSWKDISIIDQSKRKIEQFKAVLNGDDPNYPHAPKKKLLDYVKANKDEIELDKILEKGKVLRLPFKKQMAKIDKEIRDELYDKFEDKVDSFLKNPRRPDWFAPRDYQIRAYRSWLDNKCQGIFSMATGTGKTLTAINIMLEEALKNGFYRNIILVPTRVLANQWQIEIEQFNFLEIIKTVDNKDWYNELSRALRRYSRENFIIITTYANFNSTKFQGLIKSVPVDNGINIIADEMHNLGSPKSLLNLPLNIKSRLGLSATPERIYDDLGNQRLAEYFSSFPPCYTYSFSMKKAIDLGRLCEYEYYPILVYLSPIEIEEYLKISKQLLLFFDSETGKFKDEATSLLLKRKRVIHKAEGKKIQLRKILRDNKDLSFTFIYVPEGFEPDYSKSDSFPEQNDDIHLLNEYINIVRDFGFKAHRFTGQTKEKEKVLDQFAKKKLDVLLAMKCLDEGVNVPRTEIGIFCSSTGNPRQFIQRRGRILRTHKDKSKAIIYDLIVAPPIESINTVTELDISSFEKSLFTNELRRVANFAYAAKNLSEIFNSETFRLAESIGINVYGFMENFEEQENQCL